jgi:TatD DNase family protein
VAPDLVDTHCHLDDEPLAGQADAVLARARASGVGHCLWVGTSVETSHLAVEGSRRHPMLRAAVGVHPHDAQAVTDEALAAIDALAQDPCVAAIGEVGLDFYRQHAPPESQVRALRGFLAMARRRNLPLALHCREAHRPLLELLEQQGGAVRGIIHCASGPPEFIREAVALGLHISFSGTVTFPNAAAVRALVPLVPDARLLLETDAPFLAPQPVRGAPNEPAHIVHTAAAVAALRGMTSEALAALTGRNARALLGFPMGSDTVQSGKSV